ncbi:hypothetical protein [Maribacter sp. 2304DJ31-5]|uniref:hypothetical protein n=1 Tax=Maribacter sp. 2304DJ31-5 TaxID=3386273 RepID=UPI0039BD2D66
MKKVIVVLGLAIFAMVLFASTNNVTNNGDIDLESLTTLNQADAECPSFINNGSCSYTGIVCFWGRNPINCDTSAPWL